MSRTPEIRVAGVEIDGMGFSWNRVAGTKPWIGSFVTSKTNSSLLKLTSNPVTIECKFFGGAKGPEAEKTITLENIFLHDPRAISEFADSWQFADVRFKLRGEKMFYSYNATRIKNERTLGIGPVATTNPATIRNNYDLFSGGRYRPDSVKNPNGTDPFNVAEILQIELGKLGINAVITQSAQDGAYIIENLAEFGVPAYQGLEKLLTLSRLQMGVQDDGKITIFSIDFPDPGVISALSDIQKEFRVKPSVIFRQNLRKVRPSKFKILFEKMQEIVVKESPPSPERIAEFDEGLTKRSTTPATVTADGTFITQDKIDKRIVVPCINVIRVPFSPRDAGGNRVFQVGEYVPIDLYLDKFGLTTDEVRNLWFNENLVFRVNEILLGGQPDVGDLETVARKITAEIKRSFRQLYMIDPAIFDKIDMWQNKRVGIVDTFSAYRPPTPVWNDYAIVPVLRHPKLADRSLANPTAITNWLVDVEDPNREEPTGASLSIENADLGVFRSVFLNDLDGVIYTLIPSGIDPDVLPTPIGTLAPGLAQFMLNSNVSLREKFTFEAMISVVWLFDPVDQQTLGAGNIRHSARYHEVEIDFSTTLPHGPAEGDDITIACRREYARFDVDGVFVNEDIINTLAQTLATKAMNVFIDRDVGIVHLGGYHAIPLTGNINSVGFTFDKDSGLVTTVDMLSIPPDPQIIQLLPDNARQYLFNQINRSGP